MNRKLRSILILATLAFTAASRIASAQQARFTTVNTQQYAVGAFCLSSLDLGSVKKGPSYELDDVTWEDFRIHIRDGQRAKLTVYDQPVDWAPLGRVDCSQTPAGRSVVLAGTIRNGTLSLSRAIQAGQRARHQIDPRQINLTLGNVTVNPQPFLGGTVSFVNRKVWLYNDDRIDLQTGTAPVGNVLMEVTDIALKDAQLRLAPDAPAVPVTLKADHNVFFSYGLANGSLALVRGTMWASNFAQPVTQVQLAGLGMSSATLKANRIELLGGKEATTAVLRTVELNPSEVTHGPAPAVRAKLTSPLAIREIRSVVPHSRDIAVLEAPVLNDVRAVASAFEVLNTGGAVSLSAGAKIALDHLDAGSWTGNIALSGIQWPGAHAVVPTLSLGMLDLHVAGPKDNTTFSGTGLVSALRAGALGLGDVAQGAQNFVLGPSQRADSLTVPFNIQIQPAAGQLTLDAPGRGAIGVSGGVDRLVLRGTVEMGEGMTIRSVTIPSDGLDIAVRAAVSAQPLLYGSTPQFAGGTLEIKSMSELSLTPAGSSGVLSLGVSAVVLPDPSLAFDQGRFRLNAPLQAVAAATFSYGLGDGTWALFDGSLEVTGINARTIGDTPVEFDQLTFKGATLTLGRLAIVARAGALQGEASDFHVTADAMTHGTNPKIGASAATLALASLKVEAKQEQSALKVTNVIGQSLNATLKGIDYVSADGFSAHGDAVLTADMFSSDAVNNLRLDIPSGTVTATGAVDGKASLVGLQLVASGSKATLDGTIRLGLRGVTLGGVLPLTVEGQCAPMPLRTSARLGDLDFQGTLDDGVINGSVNAGNVSLHVREHGHYNCEFNKDHHIKDKWVLFSVPCGLDGFNVKMCDVTAGPIDARIHWTVDIRYFEVGATATNTTVRLNGAQGITACGGQLTNLNGPFVAGAYVPTFNRDIPFISDVINGFIVAMGYGVESSLANTFGSLTTLTNVFHKPQLLGGC